MKQGRLSGQVAWVSGAAMGMGRAIAELFAAEGASVAVIDVKETEGAEVVDAIRTAGGKTMFRRCDVSVEDDVRRSIDATVEQYDGLQIIVNCAAISAVQPLHKMTESLWDRLMAVNVKSIFLSTKHGVGHLLKNERSYIVNIGSISSFVAQAGTPAYTTTKGAVLLLSQSLALDYAHAGLRCNCVCPGISDTPALRSYYDRLPGGEEILAGRLRRVPLNRIIRPAEVARSVLFLSTEDSSGITGTSLTVDGGYTTAAEWDSDQVTQLGS